MEDEDFLLDDTEVTEPQVEGIEEEQVQEGQEVEETTETTEPVEQVQEPFLRVKYNKEERGLTQEEALMYAQKGLNYDKIQERLQQVESNPGLAYLNELAQRSNTDIDTLVNYWREQERQNELNQLVQSNIPQEYAEEILNNRKFREQFEEKQRQEQEQAAQRKEFNEFFEAFPGVDPKNIPKEVWELNDNGIPLKFAYAEYERQQLLNEVKILKQNKQNKASSPSLGTTGFGSHDNIVSDPFLEGFNSI